jgi:hypothetical protein
LQMALRLASSNFTQKSISEMKLYEAIAGIHSQLDKHSKKSFEAYQQSKARDSIAFLLACLLAAHSAFT